MRQFFILFVYLTLFTELKSQSYYPYQGILFNKVKLHDAFWSPKIEVNRIATIPWSFGKCEETGRIKNFVQAAARSGKFNGTYVFDDSDVYKIIEGGSYSLQQKYDKQLDKYMDSLIAIIAAAQEPDGYLYTCRTMGAEHKWLGNGRYDREHEHSHELYNMGHFYEAATAHFWATGKKNMLDLATKNADHLLTVFGPDKRSVAPGHQVIEIGLVKLYLATGKKEYLNLSQFFIECRGKRSYPKAPGTQGATVWDTGEYWQDHKPAIDQTEAIGHAVRATYLYSGMADVAALTQNQAYINAIHKIWQNAAGKKTYITGGIGAAGDWEGFGPDYDLPNDVAYCETCAGIGNVYWNHRMFMLTGDAKYMDLVERTLYNGILGGIGLDGKSFYYANPMEYTIKHNELSGEHQRSPWFTCSCCPSNICRFMPSIPGYIYAQKGRDLYVNLYMSSTTEFELDKATKVNVDQSVGFPWKGNVKIKINTSKNTEFTLKLRIPGYADGDIFPTDLYSSTAKNQKPIVLSINGKALPINKTNDGFITIARQWSEEDVIDLEFPFDVVEVASHPSIKYNNNLKAVQKGPILYCAEYIDNDGKASNIILDQAKGYSAQYKPSLLNGIMTLQTQAKVLQIKNNTVSTKQKKVTLIPYFARSNRGVGEMRLWFPTKVSNVIVDP